MTNKLKYFIGNWKMFGDLESFKIVSKINQFSKKYNKSMKFKIVLCVPNTLIHYFNSKIKSKYISLGAQNCHQNEKYGSYTGSITSNMLRKVGSEYIILGHSENRAEGDTNESIRKKIDSALNSGLKIIFCIGETKKEKIKKKTFHVLEKQIRESLKNKINKNKILFAYEPIWSIGTNIVPTQIELEKNIIFIKKKILKVFKNNIKPTILYGGSVNPKNIGLFSDISDIDGFLIGGASQSSKKFIDIIKKYYK